MSRINEPSSTTNVSRNTTNISQKYNKFFPNYITNVFPKMFAESTKKKRFSGAGTIISVQANVFGTVKLFKRIGESWRISC